MLLAAFNTCKLLKNYPDGDSYGGPRFYLKGMVVLIFSAGDYLKGSTYTSYSGADIVATIQAIGGKPMVFGELQTITYSTHREVQPIRSIGNINPRGFTRGPRTIAGSMIFTVFDRHVIQNVLKEGLLDGTIGSDARIS